MSGIRRKWQSLSLLNNRPYARNFAYHCYVLFSWLEGEKPITKGKYGKLATPYYKQSSERESQNIHNISLSKDLTEFTIDNFRNCPPKYKGDMKRTYYAWIEKQRKEDKKQVVREEARIRDFVYKNKYPEKYALLRQRYMNMAKSRRSFKQNSLLKSGKSYSRYELVCWLENVKPIKYYEYYPSQKLNNDKYHKRNYSKKLQHFSKGSKMSFVKSYVRYVLFCWLEGRKPLSKYYFKMNDINIWRML